MQISMLPCTGLLPFKLPYITGNLREGQHIEIPQIEALLSTMPEPVMTNSITGNIPAR